MTDRVMTVGYYRLPDVDGTPKYCQNALEVAVGSRVAIVRNVNPDLTGFGRSGS